MLPLPGSLLAALGASLAAGFVNALAGGGTLITFPVLTLLGLPAIVANVTSTVALCPGYLGATWSQRGLLSSPAQRGRLLVFAPLALVGGLAGGALLLASGERLFRSLVPWLILLAAFLLAIQTPVRRLLASRPAAKREDSGAADGLAEAAAAAGAPASDERPVAPGLIVLLCIAAAAVYGGYFGAGVSVIILAALSLALGDSLIRLNALKQAIALSCNVAAALFFLASGKVNWAFALVMAFGALGGGMLGGRLAGRIPSGLLRALVVSIGAVLSLYYFLSK